jgi:flagellar export protein FliJ
MKGLATLIRLAKFNLDEKRRQLAELERLREHLLRSLDKLAVEVSREQQTAAESQDPFTGYASYARAALDRRAVIEQSLADLAPQLGAAAEAVTAAFQEFKRYELAEENNHRRAAAKDRRREQARLDETGLSRFQRARRSG